MGVHSFLIQIEEDGQCMHKKCGIKEVENWEGKKNVRNPQILCTLVNFFSIFGLGFFQKSFEHLLRVMKLFKKYPTHMKSQKILKISKK